VDNLCHSLVGAALSAAGLRRRTALATATMVIGANLPDVDALIYLVGDSAAGLAFRRGWTHGVLAMAVLPLILTGIMLGVGHWQARRRARANRPENRIPLRAGGLLLVSALSIWSHPLFDLLNTYGVRLLMPFSSRWFYGDTLFIIDPWLWSALGLGSVMSLLRARRVPVGAESAPVMARVHRPARFALIAVGAYVAVMAISSRVGRVLVERQAVAARRPPATRVMVAPEPLTPMTRGVVRDLGLTYETGTLRWSFPPRYEVTGQPVPTLRDTTLGRVDTTAAPRAVRNFLVWARFPFRDVTAAGDSVVIRLDDARYARPGRASSFASVTIVGFRPPAKPPQ
jgi:inner membrane protein